MVTDILLHSVDEFQLIILFHGISKREALIGAYVGMVEQLMDLIGGTVIELVDLVEPVHCLFGVGGIWVQFVLWHFYGRGQSYEQKQTECYFR